MSCDSPLGRSRPETLYSDDHEYHIRIGQLEGVVHPHDDRYYFSVRNLTCDGPTIYGFGVDFRKAVTAVEELIERLQAQSKHDVDVRLALDVPKTGIR